MKSREEERFVNEIHHHKQELRSRNELLASLHESGRNEEGKVTRSHKETWIAPSTKETGADPVILTPRASLFTKRTTPTKEKNVDNYSRSFTIRRRFGSVSPQIGYYDTSSLWPRWTTTWWIETLGPWETSIDESVCTQRSSRLWWWMLVTLNSREQY